MPPALVIFDCDGVLVDSEGISNAVLADALRGLGLAISAEEAHDRYRGMFLSDIRGDAERRLGAPLPADFLETFERDRAEAFRASLQPVPGAASAVREVRAMGFEVCVASQGRLSKTELTLTVCGLRDLFEPEALFSAHSVARGKPAPDLFLYAAATMGFSPAQCVVVEDTMIGVEAALAAGMRVIAYAPDGDGEVFSAAGVVTAGVATVDALDELPECLGSLAS
ncbi:MAG TPA: HAD family phosphatase [Solirubrobacteraceae bacterium]|nr:HAD family phosphatase [Solirubrobacteraceae bacterium]